MEADSLFGGLLPELLPAVGVQCADPAGGMSSRAPGEGLFGAPSHLRGHVLGEGDAEDGAFRVVHNGIQEGLGKLLGLATARRGYDNLAPGAAGGIG